MDSKFIINLQGNEFVKFEGLLAEFHKNGGQSIETEELEFETSNLSERDLADVTPGQQAQITLKSSPSRMIRGRVSRVSPQASGTIGDAATFTVVIDLEAADLLLLAGMTGRVEIQPAVDDG